MRAAPPLALAALLTAIPLALALGPVPTGLAEVVDEAWLQATAAALGQRHGPAFLDVGYAAAPRLHIAALFAGPVPSDLGPLHPSLPTVGHDASGWEPLSHDMWVPTMLLLAQQVPEGIRPGSWMSFPAACTMAHVVADDQGGLHILTAGHCVDDGAGTRVGLVTEGDIGEVLAYRNGGIGQDYALVRIDPKHHARVNPTMVGWGGPVGLATGPEDGVARQYGWGYLTWMAHATRCRAGLTEPSFWGAASWAYTGQVASGDSGSGVNAPSGAAMGILTHGGGITGNVLGTRADHALARLEAATGLDLHIVDGAPMLPVCNVATG